MPWRCSCLLAACFSLTLLPAWLLAPTEAVPSLCRLKTINLVIRSTQGAEELVKKYEDQLKNVQTVPADLKELEASKAELKVPGLCRAGGRPGPAGTGAELCSVPCSGCVRRWRGTSPSSARWRLT